MNDIIKSIVENLIESAKVEAGSMKNNLNHRFLEGKILEIALSKMISPLLPSQYGIGNGKICDSKSFLSREIDLILFSKRLLQPFLFDYNLGLYPIETVMTCIEVKSNLTKKRLKTTFESFKEIKDKAFIATGDFEPNDQNKSMKKLHPTFELFAFDSDILNKSEYKIKEFNRYKEIDPEWDTNPTIRSICIINKGWWIYWKNEWWFQDAQNDKKETISYLSNTLNTLGKIESSRGNPRIGEYLTDINSLVKL